MNQQTTQTKPGSKETRPAPRRRSRRVIGRKEREKSEFDQRIIDIRRVTRVMAGGRRFSFSVVVVLGNRNGKVGVGVGKGGDTAIAIEKAVRNARKNMFEVPRTKEQRIRHEIDGKFGSSIVTIRPAPGRGLVAGSSVRAVLELAGVTDVTGKLLSRSKNKLNNARATILALKTLQGK